MAEIANVIMIGETKYLSIPKSINLVKGDSVKFTQVNTMEVHLTKIE